MSINALLDRIDFQCTVCGESKRVGCDCFIKLRCPRCKREQSDYRQAGDPDGEYIEAVCPDCIDSPRPKRSSLKRGDDRR